MYFRSLLFVFNIGIVIASLSSAYAESEVTYKVDGFNPHYSDLLQSWADDESLPLHYSRELIKKHTKAVIKLEPAQRHQAGN